MSTTADIKWFTREVLDKINATLFTRMSVAMLHLHGKVVRNLSVPVGKTVTKSGHVIVTERSKPGEFPRADTTLLMKSIFFRVKKAGQGVVDGYVGHPVWYGLKLETQMNRLLLKESLYRELTAIKIILGAFMGGIEKFYKGGQFLPGGGRAGAGGVFA